MKKIETDDVLEYVGVVAAKFCVPEEAQGDEELSRIAIDEFREWYSGEATADEAYQRMAKLYEDDDLQKLVKKHGYDCHKFWFLICFIKNYVDVHSGFYSKVHKQSIGEKIQIALELFKERGTTITVRNGKRKVVLSEELTIISLSWFLQGYLDRKQILNYAYETNYKKCPKGCQMAFFCRLFFHVVDTIASKKQRRDWWLTSKLLYMAGYLEEDVFFYGQEVKIYKGKKRVESTEWIKPSDLNETIESIIREYRDCDFVLETDGHLDLSYRIRNLQKRLDRK